MLMTLDCTQFVCLYASAVDRSYVDTMYQTFVDNPRMTRIRERTVWIHVDVPGQGYNVPDLPPEYVVVLYISEYRVSSTHA